MLFNMQLDEQVKHTYNSRAMILLGKFDYGNICQSVFACSALFDLGISYIYTS